MKIINTYKSPNFGYNEEYHKKVREYLSTRKKNTIIAKNLLEADTLALGVEKQVNEMEKSSSKTASAAYKDLTDWLVDYKSLLALYMDMYFPNLKYVGHIANQYQKEALETSQQNAIHWRAKLCKQVDSFIPKPVTTDEAIAKQQESQQETQQEIKEKQQTLEDVRNQAIDDYEHKKSLDILELYRPTKSSPTGFESVAGMDEIKKSFKDNLLDYIENPLLAELDEYEYGIRAPRGFLFYGPPGCGKTYITQALAAESKLDMFKMDVSKIGSKYVNQTSVNIQGAFDFLAKYTQKKGQPCILFMDEVDSLAISRESDAKSSGENLKATTTLLKCVEQARDNNIIVIAATNKYDLLDDAFKARFDSQMYFGLPDEKLITSILKNSLSSKAKGVALSQDEEKIAELTKKLKGYSNRSIVFIVEDAAKIAKNKTRKEISFEDVAEAIDKTELEKLQEKDFQKKSKTTARKIGF